MPVKRLFNALTLWLTLLCPLSVLADEDRLLVFAAASLKGSLDEAASGFAPAAGRRLAISYAGTPALARQIEAGAPAALFISADQEWMDYLESGGWVVEGSRGDLLANRLVLIVPAAGARAVVLQAASIAAVLGERGRLAMAEPEGVPAGRYARAAFESLGLWSTVSARLAPADNVRAALRLVSLGEAPLGVVYATDAAADPGVRVVAELPEHSHAPIRYPAALIGGKPDPDARRLLEYLHSAPAQQVFARHGFQAVAR